MTPTSASAPCEETIPAVIRLRGAAWAAWNASHFAESADAYRLIGRMLYQEVTQAQLAGLFARLDAQNDLLDSLGYGAPHSQD